MEWYMFADFCMNWHKYDNLNLYNILYSPIASMQTSAILISARGHFLSEMAFVIVYYFSKVFFSSQR